MADGTELSFEEFMGELRELRGRVVAIHIRDDEGTGVAWAEGELGDLTEEGGANVSFQLGGVHRSSAKDSASSPRASSS
jgi:hypothetical protein